MSISRSNVDLMGTSGAAQSVAAGATQTGSLVDVLGDDVSIGQFKLRVRVTGTAAGSIDVRVNGGPSGQVYTSAAYRHTVTVINGTSYVELSYYTATRRVSVDVKNNDGSNAVSVWVWGELEKVS